MAELLVFPKWRVISRDEGSAPGEPRILVDPHGRHLQVEGLLRRRLIAAPDPELPAVYELVVRAGGKKFLLRHEEGEPQWEVVPA